MEYDGTSTQHHGIYFNTHGGSATGTADHHKVCQRSTVTDATIYWNGVNKATNAMPLPLPIDRDDLYIGRSHWDELPNGGRFEGEMRDLFAFNVALTESQLTALRLTREFPPSVQPAVTAGCNPPPEPTPAEPSPEPSLSTFCSPPAQLLSAVVAGFVCSTGDLNSALGHTEAQCSDAGGAWNPYTCRDVANYAASQDSDTSAITSFWHGRCCSGGDLGSGSGEPGSGSGELGSGSGESATMTLRAWTDASRRTELTDAPWPLVRATPSGCFGVPGTGIFHIAVCDMENGFVWWRNFADSACTQLTWSSRGGPFGTWCFSAALPLSHLGSHDCGAYAWCAHARIRSLMFPPFASSQLR